MLEQNDWISGSSDSSDSENARPADAGEELRRASLVELLEKRAAYRAAERHGGREHPYQLALVRELGKRIGVRCHRVECVLRPGKICGLASHRFVVTKQGNSFFANVQHWQRAAIEQAVATSTKLPRSFRLEFDIDRRAGFEHWAYLAQCSGDPYAHDIHITTVRLPRAPGRVSPTAQTEQQRGADAAEPSRRALATLASNSIPVLVTPACQREHRPRPQHAVAESANVAVRLLKLTDLLPQRTSLRS